MLPFYADYTDLIDDVENVYAMTGTDTDSELDLGTQTGHRDSDLISDILLGLEGSMEYSATDSDLRGPDMINDCSEIDSKQQSDFEFELSMLEDTNYDLNLVQTGTDSEDSYDDYLLRHDMELDELDDMKSSGY